MALTRTRSQTVVEVGHTEDEGFVWKKGKWLGLWKRRYFIKKDTLLYSFEADETTNKPILNSRDTFDLESWRLERTPEKTDKRPHLLRLTNPKLKQSFLVATNTEAEANKWFHTVTSTRMMMKYQHHIPKIIICQAQYRMHVLRVNYKRLRNAAIAIQCRYKRYCQQRDYKVTLVHVVKCQAVAKRFIAYKAYKRIQRRKRIVGELVSTEQSYVTNLRTVLELYVNPLKVASHSPVTQILPPDEIRVLFGPLEPVFQVNSEFCNALVGILGSWKIDKKLGDQFVNTADKFKFVYVPYILNYGEVSKILEKIRKKNQKFRDFLEVALEDGRSKGLDVLSYLIQPIQRLPRYELLLKDLIKFTPKSHVDYEDLNKGLQRINEVALFINEKRRDKDNISQVVSLQGTLDGKLADAIKWKPHHRLVREGEGQSTTGRKVNYIFLINEFLILAQKQKTTYHVREIISLKDVQVTVTKLETSEQINFEKYGEKAGIVVPLVKNAWSDDVVAKQQRKLDKSGSVLKLSDSTTSPPPSPQTATSPSPNQPLTSSGTPLPSFSRTLEKVSGLKLSGSLLFSKSKSEKSLQKNSSKTTISADPHVTM